MYSSRGARRQEKGAGWEGEMQKHGETTPFVPIVPVQTCP